MVKDAIYDYDNVKLILMPIVINSHYHLLALVRQTENMFIMPPLCGHI